MFDIFADLHREVPSITLPATGQVVTTHLEHPVAPPPGGFRLAVSMQGACVRIPAGPAERESLRQHMVLLPSMFDVARAIGQRGARHVETHHRVDRIGQQYWELLCALCT